MRGIVALILAVLGGTAGAQELGTFVVNEYFGMKYAAEPVSFDLDLKPARPADSVSLEGVPTQVEVLEGTAASASRIRLWTMVSFDQPGQKLFKAVTAKPSADSALTVTKAGTVGGVEVAEVSNGTFAAKVPVGSVEFASPRSAFDMPGPVVCVSPDNGKTWYGSGYLDTIARVRAVECVTASGPVFFESRITYRFENDRTYVARVRLFPGKPYAQLVEDFNVGGTSKFIFSYDDWSPPKFLGCSDSAQVKIYDVAAGTDNHDFIQQEGQRCLVRLTLWTQHGYIRDKTETTGLVTEDGSLAVGGFFIRPDRWTRAKINHVDLYIRPEVPGDRMTRGAVGLAGSRDRIAMEAWIIDGHREWAIFAMPAGQFVEVPAPAPKAPSTQPAPPAQKKLVWSPLRKAHVVEGVWPLDRINRLPLAWNADGSPPRPEDTAPCGTPGFGGTIATVLKSTEGRGGLQHFNGSEPSMRGGYDRMSAPVLQFAKDNPDKRNAAALQKLGKLSDYMAGPALAAYMCMDDSAYPGVRAMLPWTDPEAINPFYQGMENMNFNIDRYTSVLAVGIALEAMGHPEAKKFIDYARVQLDMGLDRYVYPQSGCWEESLGYAGSILRASAELAHAFKGRGVDFFADPRVINAYGFWAKVLSPPDPGFDGMRIVPPIGDHGLSLWVQVARIKTTIGEFAASPNPDGKAVAAQLLWSLQQRKAISPAADEATKPKPGEPPPKVNIPAGLQAKAPDLGSRWLQGYGSVLRGTDPKGRESVVVVRAGQSWGHHHMDKGSLWGWFRNVHFFGDAAWGSPPGGTYWNPYKQGPPGHTTIELVGVNNWPLPCKYPAPWIADDEYRPEYSYAMARCRYPYNPAMDLSRSSPPSMTNGFDRQVLLVHPDLLIVRDNMETTCPTIWRMHSYQVDGTKVDGSRVTMESPQGVTGTLSMLHPDGVAFSTSLVHDLPTEDGKGPVPNLPFGSKPGQIKAGAKGASLPYDTRSMVLKWEMPMNASASWVFAVHEQGEAPAKAERLDKDGRVVRVTLADGRTIVVLLSNSPFTWEGEGIVFEGSAGLVVRGPDGTRTYPIRAARLTAR